MTSFRASARRLLAALASVTAACSGDQALSPGHAGTVFSGLVSSPYPGPAGVVSGGASGVSYVSLVPGTVPHGASVTITNRARGTPLTVALTDGGLDPVPVPAQVGDTLGFRLTDSLGETKTQVAVVAGATPPSVVRTNPPGGKTGVALNSIILGVFSEPLARGTVDSSTVSLMTGPARVPGKVLLSPDGLDVSFVPDSGLAPNQRYVLWLTTGITSAAGLALEAPVQSGFTTGASDVRQLRILVDASRDGGVWWFPQAGSGPYEPGLDHQGKALADSLRAMGYQVDELPRFWYIALALLRQYDVVIRASAFGGYAPQEIADYQQYVSGGGRLLLLADHYGFNPGPQDTLGLAFGLPFAGAICCEVQFTAGHPVTAGMDSVEYVVGSGLLSVPATAQVLGYIPGTFLDANLNGVQDPGEPSDPPVFGVMPYGAGRIVFCGDTNLWETMPQPLLNNVLAWLTTP